MTEQLAVIKNVNIGVGDYGKACMWFDTYIGDSSAALQVLSWDQAREVLEGLGVRSALSLEGKPCWVLVGDGLIRFKRMAKI